MMSDPIADMLTHIRNAQRVGKPAVSFPNSQMKQAILAVLKEEGYIGDYTPTADGRRIEMTIKYFSGRPVIESINRISTPGLRRYASAKAIPYVKNGLGVAVVSTSRGVVSDHRARELGVGGEVLCEVS